MIGGFRDIVVRWLNAAFEGMLCMYCRFSSRAYSKGCKTDVIFVSSSLLDHKWGFLSFDRFDCDMLSQFVVLLRTSHGAREFIRMKETVLGRCLAVYAWGPDVKAVLAREDMMRDSMSGGWPLAVWSPVSVAPVRLKPIHLYFFWAALWVLFFYVGYFFPSDDLLRHAVSYLWGYDYNVPYFDSVYKTHFDMYIGFDVGVGLLHRLLGKGSLVIAQLFSLTLTFWALNRMLRGSDDNLKVVVLLCMLVLLTPRFILGRPSLACSSVMLCLIAFRDDLPVAVAVALGALMAPLYYLFWIYFVPLVIFDRRHLLGVVAGLGFWLSYSHGLYFSEVFNVLGEMGMRNVRITENVTIMGFMLTHWVFYIPLVMNLRKDWKSALSVAVMSATNQVRYVESIVPLVLGYFRFVNFKVSTVVVMGLVLLSVTFMRYRPDSFEVEAIGKLIPSGSKVLTDDMSTAYHLVFWEPKLMVSPHYGYGLTPKDTQALYLGFSKGELDCGNRGLLKFNYVVERSLKGARPGCLEPAGLAGDLRVWKVRPGS